LNLKVVDQRRAIPPIPERLLGLRLLETDRESRMDADKTASNLLDEKGNLTAVPRAILLLTFPHHLTDFEPRLN
jgi:hypothetical protein